MTKRTLTILIVAAVFAAGAAMAIASSISGGDDAGAGAMPTSEHQMSNGETMNMGK